MTPLPMAHGVIDRLEVVLFDVVQVVFKILAEFLACLEQSLEKKKEKKVSNLMGMKRKHMDLVMLKKAGNSEDLT